MLGITVELLTALLKPWTHFVPPFLLLPIVHLKIYTKTQRESGPQLIPVILALRRLR